jgi:hypothetical protein
MFDLVSGSRRRGPLEISEDMRYQRREWVVQRVGWGLMAGFVAAGAAGLFGSGPLARAAVDTGGLRVEYDRYARLDAPTEMTIEATDARSDLRIWISRDFLAATEVEHITPEPDSTELHADRVVHVFRGTKVAAPRGVSLDLRPRRLGPRSGALGLEGGASAEIHQIVYP